MFIPNHKMKMQKKPAEFPLTPPVPEVSPGKDMPAPGLPPEEPETIPIEKPAPEETPLPGIPPEEKSHRALIRYSTSIKKIIF